MRKEASLALWVAGGLTLFGISRAAYFRSTGKEIFDRDHGECQGTEGCYCVWVPQIGRPASWRIGYKVNTAHLPVNHGREDDNAESGRVLCDTCHAIEEYQRGNLFGAEEILEDGLYADHFLADHPLTKQFYFSLADLDEIIDRYLIKREEKKFYPV